jgi:hypothetical protein
MVAENHAPLALLEWMISVHTGKPVVDALIF